MHAFDWKRTIFKFDRTYPRSKNDLTAAEIHEYDPCRVFWMTTYRKIHDIYFNSLPTRSSMERLHLFAETDVPTFIKNNIASQVIFSTLKYFFEGFFKINNLFLVGISAGNSKKIHGLHGGGTRPIPANCPFRWESCQGLGESVGVERRDVSKIFGGVGHWRKCCEAKRE